MEQADGRDVGPSPDVFVEIEQRAKELSQWMDRGGKTRRGFYLAPVLKEMVDGYLGLRSTGNGPTPRARGMEEARMALGRFQQGYRPRKAAIAIFNGEPISDEEQHRIEFATGRPLASYLRSTT